MDETKIEIGKMMTSSSGVELKITNIEVHGIHLNRPTIWVTYDYDDNSHKGTERVSLDNFYNNLTS